MLNAPTVFVLFPSRLNQFYFEYGRAFSKPAIPSSKPPEFAFINSTNLMVSERGVLGGSGSRDSAISYTTHIEIDCLPQRFLRSAALSWHWSAVSHQPSALSF